MFLAMFLGIGLLGGTLTWFYGMNGYRYHKILILIEGLLLSVGVTLGGAGGVLKWFYKNPITLIMGGALFVLTILIYKYPSILTFFTGASIGIALAVAFGRNALALVILLVIFGAIGGVLGVYYSKTMIILHTAIPGTLGVYFMISAIFGMLEVANVRYLDFFNSLFFIIPVGIIAYALNVAYQCHHVFITKKHDIHSHVVNRPVPIKVLNRPAPAATVAELTPKNEFSLMKQTIFELLGELGTVSPEVKEIITKQNDLSTLQEWNKLAARSASIEEFVDCIYGTTPETQEELNVLKETILVLLADLGTVSDPLRSRVQAETNLQVLKQWNRLAARSNTLEEFEKQI